MTPCPTIEQLILFLENQLEPTEQKQVEEHVAHCAACQKALQELAEITQVIGENDSSAEEDTAFVDQVMARLNNPAESRSTPLPPAKKTKIRSGWFAALVPLAAALLFFTYQKLPTSEDADDRFLPRGANEESLNTFTSLKVFRSMNQTLEPAEAEIHADDFLAFAYSNQRKEDELKFLTVFAVDQDRQLYWYYPAFEEEGQNPCSIPIEITSGYTGLKDSIQHKLKPGELFIYALFSKKEICVGEIESLFKSQEKSVAPGAELGWPEVAEQILKFKVVP
jgi:hypothetical protein